MLQIGDITIHFVSDGVTYMDGGGVFGLIPKKLWNKVLPARDDNTVPMALTCLLVQTDGKNIVVDTGLGDRLSEKEQAIFQLERERGGLLDGLGRLGVTAADVDLVIDTHLHGDHAGGNMAHDADGQLVARFPNAEYVVQRREYADAMQPNERTRAAYIPDNYHPLVESGRMRLLDGDAEIMPGVRGMVTPGHTPAHMAVHFESGGQHALFLCDAAAYAVHLERLAWIPSFDVEPLVSLETKRRLQTWAFDHDATLLFAHDPNIHAGKLGRTENGKLKVETLDVTLA